MKDRHLMRQPGTVTCTPELLRRHAARLEVLAATSEVLLGHAAALADAARGLNEAADLVDAAMAVGRAAALGGGIGLDEALAHLRGISGAPRTKGGL